MMRGAIRGMLDSLGDKHTSYMDPSQFDQAMTSMGKEYSGIGAWVDTTTKYLTITSPMPGYPAEKAGLKPGDQVIKIDGEDMSDTPADLALKKVLGPDGTQVTLTILREGQDPFDVIIIRAKINVPSVISKKLDNNIAYLQITTFGENTAGDLKQALTTILADKPAGLILDLRYNGGGYVDTCVDVVSQFIPEGTVLIEEYGDGSRDTLKIKPGGIATEIPMVVLVNEGTASASEIFAGDMQDYNRAKLVGVTTYGKGSVQNWIQLKDNAGAVRVTVAHWLTPKERAINDVGITPDVVVELTDADIKAGKDPQLDKAVEILLGK
jgi:carboxyl-terminal processing protease